MASSGEAEKRRMAWFFIMLLLGERSVAIRTAVDVDAEIAYTTHEGDRDGARSSDATLAAQQEALEGTGPHDAGVLKTVQEYYLKGKAKEAEVTCEQLQEYIVLATDRVAKELLPLCAEDRCDFSTLDVDKMVSEQGMATSVVSAADKKKCLPLVMGSPAMQDKLGELLSIVPGALRASDTQDGNTRVQEGYLQLASFQQGVLALADGLADRKLLLDFDVPEADCPAPCQKCDRHGSATFGFRCLLRRGDKDRDLELADRFGVRCEAPARRWFRWLPFSRQCKVPDWKEAAVQHVHVSAMLSCATTTMFMGLSGQLTRTERSAMHHACLQMEQGNTLTPSEQTQYQENLGRNDGVVSSGVKLAFNIILVFGLASGLAGLRAATRGNERLPVLLEGGRSLQPVDFSAPFLPFLAAENLAIRDEDRAMYGDSHLIKRAETLRKLDVCKDMYSLKSQNTFADGVWPLTGMALTLKRSELQSDNATSWLPGLGVFLFNVATVLVSAMYAGISFIFFVLSTCNAVHGPCGRMPVVPTFLLWQVGLWGGLYVIYTLSRLVLSATSAIWNWLWSPGWENSPAKRMGTCLKEVNSTRAAAIGN